MQVRTKFSIVDAFFNYFLFTPLVILFWYGTYVLIDQLIFDHISSRLTAALLTLFIGVSVEFVITYWQNVFSSFGSSMGAVPFVIFSRIYNYLLAVANICHYRAVQEFFDMSYGQGEFFPALQWAATSIVLLWSIRAGRNITAVPFAVSVDSDSEGWFGAPTLFQVSTDRTVGYLGDTFVTVFVVWTLGPLHWITLGYVFDNLVFPNDFNTSMIAASIIGYTTVGIFSYYQYKIRSMSESFDERLVMKIALEDLFIWGATAGVIMTWKGVGMAVDALAKQYPVEFNDSDITGLCANLGSFLLLSICYVSGSLIGKGAEMDGTIAKGEGVEFSRAYFSHFFSDFIAEKEKESTTTTTYSLQLKVEEKKTK